MKLLIATAALLCAPLPALAQTAWPAAIVAGAQAMPIHIRAWAPTTRDALEALRAETAAAPAYRSVNRPALKIRPRVSLDPDAAPDVDIPAKAEWSDDQGFRIGGTKVAYKRRF